MGSGDGSSAGPMIGTGRGVVPVCPRPCVCVWYGSEPGVSGLLVRCQGMTTRLETRERTQDSRQWRQ